MTPLSHAIAIVVLILVLALIFAGAVYFLLAPWIEESPEERDRRLEIEREWERVINSTRD